MLAFIVLLAGANPEGISLSPDLVVDDVKEVAASWALDAGLSARAVDQLPFVVLGGEQRISDEIWIVGAVEGGVVAQTPLVYDKSTLETAAFVGPRYAWRVNDWLTTSIHLVAGVRTRFPDGNVDVSQLFLRGFMRAGAGVEVPVVPGVNLRASADLVGGSVGWRWLTIGKK